MCMDPSFLATTECFPVSPFDCRTGYVSRPSIGVELAPDAMSESLGMPGAMVMKAILSLGS